jgi:pyruvate formate lyase activating enzyme
VPSLNDNMDDIKRMAAWVVKDLNPDVPLHFTRFHPAYKLQNLPPTPPATLQRARATAMAEGCRYVYTGNMPGDEGENTFCPNCKAKVIERYGMSQTTVYLQGGKCPKCATAVAGVW